jgi:hypothetical protein
MTMPAAGRKSPRRVVILKCSRRNHSAAFKAKVALGAIKDDQAVAGIAKCQVGFSIIIAEGNGTAMIRLDFRVSPTWYSVTEPKIDLASLTGFELPGEVFDGDAIIVVNGVDLSWSCCET